MDIWHRERRGDDAGQVCDIGGLFGCFVSNDLRHHLLGRVNTRRYTHAAGLRQFPEIVGELADVVVHVLKVENDLRLPPTLIVSDLQIVKGHRLDFGENRVARRVEDFARDLCPEVMFAEREDFEF